MYQTKKIITACLLLLLVAIPLFFAVTVLVKQKIVQYQRNERFNKEILQTITVSAKDIYWVKPGKEILFDRKLFDVKSFETKDSIITLTGFFDHKEDKLVQHIVKLAKQKEQSNSPFSESAIKFIFFPTYTSPAQLTNEVCWKFISQQPYHSFDEMIPAAPTHELIHPPRL